MLRSLLIIFIFLFSTTSFSQLKIFACEPEWGALALELGRDQVEVFTATTALQDPHHIQARPSLLAQARQADLVVCTGAALEEGWLPLLLRQVGNARIQPDTAGYFMASDYVTLLEIPASVDRNQGHVHVQGNPHIQTDPRNIAAVARALSVRLQQIDPGHASTYQDYFSDFENRWQSAIKKWQAQAAPLRDMNIVVSHNNWIYLENWLGLKRVATLEPKPGIPPSSAYLAKVLQHIAQDKVAVILNAAYQDPRAATWLSERSDIPVVTLPFTVGGDAAANNLFNLFDQTLYLLLTRSAHE